MPRDKTTNKATQVTTTTEILSKPYARLVIPDPDGSFSAEIVEFPGSIAMGDTAAEALENLEEVAADWIAAALEQGQDIPEPLDAAGYSGKLVLRMPKSLHQKAALYAERDGISLNQFIVTCLAENVGLRAQLRMAPVVQTPYAPMIVMQTNVLVSHFGQPQQAHTNIGRSINFSSGSTVIVTDNDQRVRAHA